jgi:outer membrane beta-barrel protein
MTAKARTLALIGALLAFCAATATPSDSFAQDKSGQKETLKRKFKDKIHVVQPKPVLQKMRFELAPRLGMTVNDSVVRNYRVGLNANFHIMEALYLGLTFDWYDFGGALGGPTDTFEQVQNQTGTVPESAVLNWFAGLEIGYVPFWGKFAIFNRSIAFYDFAITVGGGAVNGESLAIPSPYTTGGGTLSLQGRIFMNKWIAMTLEVRDVIFLAELDGASGALSNVASMGLGVSFFLPTKFKYSDKIVEVPGS